MAQCCQISLDSFVLLFLIITTWSIMFSTPVQGGGDDCFLRPVIHVLQQPGCVPKPIPSFACQGSCASYVQVSGSKFWQVERSCMCCQEMGEREASIGIFCPKSTPRFRKIVTRAPVECMCRPCTAVDESAIKPQEVALMVAAGDSEFMSDMPVMENFHFLNELSQAKEIPVV
ncbi:bursicon-like [Stegodyphus dumicola]|uniref:bursicon-like n=1 Tax=Stegodyphus dumicola TaxID=202533 RepID=UPI0015B21C2E|nr:bursicon-like [Stegodyphus dumicola]